MKHPQYTLNKRKNRNNFYTHKHTHTHLHTRTHSHTRQPINSTKKKIKTTKAACNNKKTKLIHFNCLMLPRLHAIYEQYVIGKFITQTHMYHEPCTCVCMCTPNRANWLTLSTICYLHNQIIHTIPIHRQAPSSLLCIIASIHDLPHTKQNAENWRIV